MSNYLTRDETNSTPSNYLLTDTDSPPSPSLLRKEGRVIDFMHTVCFRFDFSINIAFESKFLIFFNFTAAYRKYDRLY
jgi:hypothetical protein